MIACSFACGMDAIGILKVSRPVRRSDPESPRWERKRVPKSGGQDRRGRHAVVAKAPFKRPPPRHALALSRAASVAMFLNEKVFLRAVYAASCPDTTEVRHA
jgi:hypothetical protein